MSILLKMNVVHIMKKAITTKEKILENAKKEARRKGLEKIGQQIGQRKKQKVFKDTAGGKIFFHNMTSLS